MRAHEHGKSLEREKERNASEGTCQSSHQEAEGLGLRMLAAAFLQKQLAVSINGAAADSCATSFSRRINPGSARKAADSKLSMLDAWILRFAMSLGESGSKLPQSKASRPAALPHRSLTNI